MERREIVVAGHLVNAPLDVVVAYAAQFGGTLARYDFGDRGLPDVLTAEEIWSTRIIRSRVTYAERDELERVATECAQLWAAIPFETSIRSADPAIPGGVYADMLKLYMRLIGVPGVRTAKASKILHFKRPHLYPILDSRLELLYQDSASKAAQEYPELGHEMMYWAAIRNDVLMNEQPTRHTAR